MQTERTLDPQLSPEAYKGIRAELMRTATAIGWLAACEEISETLQLAEADEHPWQVYALAAQLAPPAYTQALRFEALFMLRSIEMQRVTRAQEARKRSANGRKGGAPRKVSDEALQAARDEFLRKHPNGRGLNKWLSGKLCLDPKTVSAALARLKLKE